MIRRWTPGLALCLFLFAAAGLRAEDRTFDSQGIKIHYTVEGAGEPVLLIHGFAINAQMQWHLPGIVKALARDYRVITLDNRGHGRSGKPHDPKKYGQEMVEDAVRLLDHLHIQKAHVVGYSMGAFITLKLLASHPDRLLSATLGGAGRPRPGDVRLVDELAESLEQGKGFGPLLRRLTPKGRPPLTEEQIKATSQFLGALNDLQALTAVVRSFKDFALDDATLQANPVPTLALIGELDPLKDGVDALQGKLAHLTLVVIPRADHMTAFTNPLFLQQLTAFLNRSGRNGSGSPPAGVPTKPAR